MRERWLPNSHGVSETEVFEASSRARRLLRLDQPPTGLDHPWDGSVDGGSSGAKKRRSLRPGPALERREHILPVLALIAAMEWRGMREIAEKPPPT